MALNNAANNSAGLGWTAAFPFLSLHTTGAVTASTGESTAPRVSAAWAVSAAGVATSTARSFTGGAASGPVVRVGYWSLATGGTYGGGVLLTGDQSFNAAGAYTVDLVTENVTSS